MEDERATQGRVDGLFSLEQRKHGGVLKPAGVIGGSPGVMKKGKVQYVCRNFFSSLGLQNLCLHEETSMERSEVKATQAALQEASV